MDFESILKRLDGQERRLIGAVLLIIPVVLAKAGLVWLLQQADDSWVIPTALLWALRQPLIGYAVIIAVYLSVIFTLNARLQARADARAAAHAAAEALIERCPDGAPCTFVTADHLGWSWCSQCGKRNGKEAATQRLT